MARIGVLPTKTSVELREPDGDAGTIPGATPSNAGVMTARQAQMLEDVWSRLQGGADFSAPVIIERPSADMSQYATKLEVKALLQAIPKAFDMAPQIQAVRGELMALRGEMTGHAAPVALPATSGGDVVDQTARRVLEQVIGQFEVLDGRLRQVEAVADTLRMLADVKGQERT